jgi:EAL domain-containing protein (putative c-di-GMP-specific phosphodiesterase class I)
VQGIVWGAAVDPRQIVFEITESLLMEDSESAIATLWQLRGLGLRLAIDDFGTGYSSLSRLCDLPIDELKIDKSFTDRINAPTGDSVPIITATVAMGHALGLVVVAEGVETAAQANFLRDIECDLLQGYMVGRPMSADQITPLLGQALFDHANPFGDEPEAFVPRRHDDKPFVPRILPSVAQSNAERLFAR